ncbi:MAG: type II secretion system F family protein [Nonlabens sp.]|uniref:type II secretion system F family protein n=1 Tax=Nonlabens sp. TaxID=1888209 RepID=UPI00321A4738
MAIDFSQHNINKELAPKNLEPSSGISIFSFLNKLGIKEREMFYRELSVLLTSGLDLKSSYEILKSQYKKKKVLYKMISSILISTSSGKGIRESFEIAGGCSQFELISLSIAEETKNLPLVLENLADYFKSKIELKRQIISLLTYPVIILLITAGVLYFMLDMVVPMFSNVFKQFGADLPYLTRKIMGISQNLSFYTYTILGSIVVLIIVNKVLSKNEQFNILKEKTLFRVPVFGALLKTIALNRFCSSMSILLDSNVQLTKALSLSQEVMEYKTLRTAIAFIENDIALGKSLSESMVNFNIFDTKMITMISVGEKSNSLVKMFNQLSSQYNDDVSHKAKLIGTILEPLIIVVIGTIVGVIMLAMYAPMFDLSKIMSL